MGGRAVWDYVKPVEPRYWSTRKDKFGVKSSSPARFYTFNRQLTYSAVGGVSLGLYSLGYTSYELYNGYQENRFVETATREGFKSLGAYGGFKAAAYFVVSNPTPWTKHPLVAGAIVVGGAVLGSVGADVIFYNSANPIRTPIRKDPNDFTMPKDNTNVFKEKYFQKKND